MLALALAAWAWIADPVWFEIHHTPLACIREPRELRSQIALRVLALVLAAVLVFFVRPRLARWLASVRITKGDIGRISLALVLALGVSELLLRRPSAASPPPPPCLVCIPTIPDPTFWWVLKPSTEHRWKSPLGREVVYYTDAEGNRVRAANTSFDHQRPTILVGGESIAVGIGVSYEDTFAGMLEDRLGVQVVNAAVFGYGMDQAYMRERDIAGAYSSLIAIVTTFVPEEVERPEREERPSLHVDAAGALTVMPPAPEWLHELELRRLLYSIYHDDEPIRTMRALAKATTSLAKDHGAYALFVTTNFMEPCIATRENQPTLYRAIFDEQNIPRVHVDLPASQRAEGDFHPGPRSQAELADAVEQELRRARVLP